HAAHRRHAIEQFHEEAKEELGWDQYQGRLWPGFHRHAVTVMLALSFLLCLELRQRHRHPKFYTRSHRPCRTLSPFSRVYASVSMPPRYANSVECRTRCCRCPDA